jgi:hypothetical protein
MSNETNATDSPTMGPTVDSTSAPTLSPTIDDGTDVPTSSPSLDATDSPTQEPTELILSTSAPTLSPTPQRDDIDVIRLPDYTKPKSIDSIFIILPVILVLVIALICCQKKAKLYDNR